MSASFDVEYPYFKMKYVNYMQRAKENLDQARSGSREHLFRLPHDLSICRSRLNILMIQREANTYGVYSNSEEIVTVQNDLSDLIAQLELETADGRGDWTRVIEEVSSQVRLEQHELEALNNFYTFIEKEKETCLEITNRFLRHYIQAVKSTEANKQNEF